MAVMTVTAAMPVVARAKIAAIFFMICPSFWSVTFQQVDRLLSALHCPFAYSAYTFVGAQAALWGAGLAAPCVVQT